MLVVFLVCCLHTSFAFAYHTRKRKQLITEPGPAGRWVRLMEILVVYKRQHVGNVDLRIFSTKWFRENDSNARNSQS